MLKKTIELGTPGTRLSVRDAQLVVSRPDQDKVTLPIEDLGVVIVDDIQATYTQSVFIEILNAGATLMVTGRDHMPLGLMLPLDAHHVQTERHRAQTSARKPQNKRIWQRLVKAKIKGQAEVLEAFAGSDAGLHRMSRRVRSGDPDNLEAQAAQRYWPRLFDSQFRRNPNLPGINALLNYGYAIMRAAVARAIVAAGLIPTLGVFHRNRRNPFCLADDLLEPYRPLVDWRVKLISEDFDDQLPDLDHRSIRAELLSIFNETILVGELRLPVLIAVQRTASSLASVWTGERDSLELPASLPLAPELLDGA